jgi:cytochrome c-type biogenesis protein CcmE
LAFHYRSLRLDGAGHDWRDRLGLVGDAQGGEGPAMKAKHQRLTLAIVALVAIIGSAVIAMTALKSQASFFCAPSDFGSADCGVDKPLRLGGMVVDKSIEHLPDGVTIRFAVTDKAKNIPVIFKGITPDLFKENSGVVAEGRMGADGVFTADTILAKHDENYMPPQMAGKMHKTETLKP